MTIKSLREPTVRLQDKAQAIARDIGNNALAISNPASINAKVRTTVDRFNGIDISVNKFAVFDMHLLLKATEVSFDRQGCDQGERFVSHLPGGRKVDKVPKLRSSYGSQACGRTSFVDSGMLKTI